MVKIKHLKVSYNDTLFTYVLTSVQNDGNELNPRKLCSFPDQDLNHFSLDLKCQNLAYFIKANHSIRLEIRTLENDRFALKLHKNYDFTPRP